ncbi:MAG: helix-turn-helix domain-containing protein [Verrucomicrobiota bacterium]
MLRISRPATAREMRFMRPTLAIHPPFATLQTGLARRTPRARRDWPHGAQRRTHLGYSQSELARRLGSSQSRVAKLEAGESNVSIDLLVRAMLATGAKPREVGAAIAAGK